MIGGLIHISALETSWEVNFRLFSIKTHPLNMQKTGPKFFQDALQV